LHFFVTGCAGFIGSNLTDKLLSDGHNVVGYDNFSTGQEKFLAKARQSQKFTLVQGDTQDLTALTRAIVGCDFVFHLAANADVRFGTEHPRKDLEQNTIATYNVLEAALKLGIRKVIIASSETTYGVCFAEGDKDFHSFPLEEDYDIDPMDSYGLSKVVNEKTARAFAMRTGADVYALRIGNVIEPHEYDRFPGFLADPPSRKRNAWSYIDARDLGQIVHLCIEKDGLGFEVFNAVNDTITANEPTREFLKRWAPNTPISRELGEFEAPLSNRKIREVLGFKEEHNWRKYVSRS